MPEQLAASTVSREATTIILDLERKEYKLSEIMAIALAASKIAEAMIQTRTHMAIAANAVTNMFDNNQ